MFFKKKEKADLVEARREGLKPSPTNFTKCKTTKERLIRSDSLLEGSSHFVEE
jgi:hypothetical protein